MSGDVVTYRADDDGTGPSWVIADGGGWCPGAFTTDDAARYAHRMGYDRMLAFWQQWQGRASRGADPVRVDRRRARVAAADDRGGAVIPVTVDYGDGTLETMSSDDYANRWVCARGHAVAIDDVEVVSGRAVGPCVLCDRVEVPIEFVAAPPELRTRLPEPIAARWRCATCGGFVAGGSVTLNRGRPLGTCDRCGGGTTVPVLYERTATRHDDDDERPIGVDPSLLDYRAVARESFLDVIRRLPAGERFSANTLRSRLDALEVPPGKRGRLFGEAVRLELARPLFVESGVLRVRALEASTGRSAKHAGVKLYERTDTT